MVKQKSGCRQKKQKNVGQSVAERTGLYPFVRRVYQIVDDPSTDSIISWSQSGKSFIIWDPAEFSRDLLKKSFDIHTDLSRFMARLKIYGIRKVDSSEHWEIADEDFVRGEPERVRRIYSRLGGSDSDSSDSDTDSRLSTRKTVLIKKKKTKTMKKMNKLKMNSRKTLEAVAYQLQGLRF